MNDKYLKFTKLLKILCEPSRLEILNILHSSKIDLCVMELSEILNMSQSATSHQLAKLQSANIIIPVRHGQMICYKFSNSVEAKLASEMLLFFNTYSTKYRI